MKFLHLSDLHIGIKLYGRDLKDDQAFVFEQIRSYAASAKPDAILIAGDIYDKAVPSAEAVEQFDRFATSLLAACPETTIMMISGNHDSAPRIDCFRGVLSRQSLYMIGQPPQTETDFIEQVTLTDAYGPVHFYLLPFVKPSMVRSVTGNREDGGPLSYNEAVQALIKRETINTTERNVLVSHQFYLPGGIKAEDVPRMDSEIRMVGGVDEVSADILQPFDYAALGHIHKPMKVGSDNFRYCGTPLAYSVSEAGQNKGMIEVEMGEKGDVKTRVIPLQPLHEIKVLRGTAAQIMQQKTDDYVTVTLTERAEWAGTDLHDQLRAAFPNLLEVRRELSAVEAASEKSRAPETMTPYELCLSFLKDTEDREKEILQDVIQKVQEEDR